LGPGKTLGAGGVRTFQLANPVIPVTMPKFTARKTLKNQSRWLPAMLLASAIPGCGKPATIEDCELILTRITELELSAANVSDPAARSAQIAQTKATFSGASQEECVGRRISADALACVKLAETAEQIISECFD
jgi:hypothetical protein